MSGPEPDYIPWRYHNKLFTPCDGSPAFYTHASSNDGNDYDGAYDSEDDFDVLPDLDDYDKSLPKGTGEHCIEYRPAVHLG